mmetsp:Transcript_50953/g.65252  ORF Transcript_50953/g.65252 Transcript_50953/m.65252 type:complete len:182 (-) Transcript_50953:197-742(-)
MFRYYKQCVKKYPVRTKMATGGTLAVSSDGVAQLVENNEKWDIRRSSGLALFGFAYMGFFQHYLFSYYSRKWPVVGTTKEKALPALKTVAVHMLGTYPFFYFPVFVLASDTLARGRSITDAWDHLMREWWRLYKPGFIIWTPVMAAQFFLVPVPLQVLWITSFSFAWTTFMSLSLFKFEQK